MYIASALTLDKIVNNMHSYRGDPDNSPPAIACPSCVAGFFMGGVVWKVNSMAVYPQRGQFFAHKFVRLLQKSCAAMDIGHQACLLLCYIVHTEDAVRYSGPVRFWNEQLMTVMGFKSPKQLNEARTKAEKAGWLVYERSGNRHVGRYFVTVPAGLEGLDDTPIEDNRSVNHSEFGTNSGTNAGAFIPNSERIAERISDGSRNEYGTESGKHSIPIPIPIPIPLETQDAHASARPPKRKRFEKPTPEQVATYATEASIEINAQAFCDYYEANGWRVGRNAMKDWKAAARNWAARDNGFASGRPATPQPKKRFSMIEAGMKLLEESERNNGQV